MPPNLTAIKVYVEGKRFKNQLQKLSKQAAEIAASISESAKKTNGKSNTADKEDEVKSRKWIDIIKAKYSEFLIPPKNPKRK